VGTATLTGKNPADATKLITPGNTDATVTSLNDAIGETLEAQLKSLDTDDRMISYVAIKANNFLTGASQLDIFF
jgi:hypothetical protein